MKQPSVSLNRLFYLLKGVLLSGLIFGVIGFIFSIVVPPKATTIYHSRALISLTQVRSQKIGQTQYLRYSNGSELSQVFINNFKSPTTNKAVSRALKKADLAATFTRPNDIAAITLKNSGLIEIKVTTGKPRAAVKAANIAAKVAVQQFEKQYQLHNSRVLARATSADRQITTISRSELMIKFIFAGILLGFLWIFVRELWQRHVTSR
ncbi:YveK family protein [Loigolactobacillus jiayinensis]|uniref:Capsular polysaccharide biosynthesis protein n=1 Tax=Loigolactobacillus jiayinensis TaxID=2486016 RepID=A0ABW1RC41_9LACO|nr:hypothetical protein [Loigolactobacillus jiayinensis]